MAELIAIASGKGGVGKTWLAISLAQALSRLGRRVLLFDGDLGLANIDVQLGLDAGTDLATVLSGGATLREAARDYPAGGFQLICGRSGSGRLAALARARGDQLFADLAALAGDFDVALLDLPAGLDRLVRSGLALATRQLVVLTDEPTALTDAYALVKVTHKDSARPPPAVVVNLAASHQAGRQTFQGFAGVCARFLDLQPSLAGVVRRDGRVPDAIRHQVPLLVRHPLAPAARDLEVVAHELVKGA